MKCHSALESKGILAQATTQINLEDILLREMRPSQNDKCWAIPFICNRLVKTI